jgi:hypothetical protein
MTRVHMPGAKVSLQIQASDSPGLPLAYQASGLPAGLSINGSTGLISGTMTQAATTSQRSSLSQKAS